MSSYALFDAGKKWICFGLLSLLPLACGNADTPAQASPAARADTAPRARVIVVRDPDATSAFEPNPDKVAAMLNRALASLTGKSTAAAAWRTLVSTQDTIGIKVFSSPGPHSGTRPAVVAAVVEGLLQANVPARQIIVWDKHRADLRHAGYFDFEGRYGIRVQGCDGTGYDEKAFYLPDRRIVGQLVWGDLEFGRQGEGVGLKSFVAKLVSQQITKIINVTPLLNHNSAGVSGNLCSLGLGSVDNTIRFEAEPGRLATAVPELYALPALSDRVVLNIVDALIGQYQGEHRSLLHYSLALNELWVSRDPVALDVLALRELDVQRKMAGMSAVSTNYLELYQNAALLDLGVCDLGHIQIEREK